MARSDDARDADRWDRAIDTLAERVRRKALPLASPADLDPLLDRIGDARFVLLGEATHGTHEFYTWRAAITRRLIEERGVSFLAVEGDWPDCYAVNRYVKGYAEAGGSAEEVLHAFARWPTWMWANREIAELAEWLRAHNAGRPTERQVGFYGLDVYSLWDSMREVVRYLDRVDPEAARQARRAYGCFDPYHQDEQQYAAATTALVPTACEDEAVAMLGTLRARAPEYREDGRDAFFAAEQNALVVRNAERYYRAMMRGGSASWNVRDRHMAETLDRLMAHHGPGAKAIVWEHNTHIGDARFTTMRSSRTVNVGQLVREAHGESPEQGDGVVLVGFGTHRGTVIAGEEWGEPMRRVRVPPAREGSWEDVLHRAGDGENLLLVFDGTEHGGIRGLETWREHRAIGVVYNPEYERFGNYVPTIVPRRYDAFLFIDETRALDALHLRAESGPREEMETFPSGM
jgi:erythromycin esterase-like protein